MLRNQTGIIVLAAGASTRMGEPKQLIQIEGDSMVRRALQAALLSDCQPVMVVLGANGGLIKPQLADLPVLIVENSSWEKGLSSSIQSGLKAMLNVAPDLAGVILMVADQPNVTEVSLKRIIGASGDGASLVAARFNDVIGTPAFFPKHYFEELLALDGRGGARSVLEKYHQVVLKVEMPEAAEDLDTPADLAAFKSKSSPTMRAYETNRLRAACQHREDFPQGQSRRQFITTVTAAGVGVVTAPAWMTSAEGETNATSGVAIDQAVGTLPVLLRVNGIEHNLQLDPRVTLLDALRERLGLTGSKKGCDHGQCGACTVLVNGRRINSCLALAVVHQGDEIITIEGLAKDGQLHPVQQAFLEHDGFQCGYCTPGQICSAVALLHEGHSSSDAEIREWMSGNICRCGAYTNIVAAIQDAKNKTQGSI